MNKTMLIAFLIATTPAFAKNDPAITAACQGDYMRLCSHTQPWSSSCKACMRGYGRSHQLSQGCVKALVDGGEVSSADKAAFKKK